MAWNFDGLLTKALVVTVAWGGLCPRELSGETKVETKVETEVELTRKLSNGKGGVIATVHPLASQAGMNALERGGNAVDAAVAAGLTLGVVDGFNSGIGGGCFMLVRLPGGEVVAVDGRETAPKRATVDTFRPTGKADTTLSQSGALASGVPGALRAYDYANRHFGRLPLADLLLPAAEIAAQGFVVDEAYYRRASGAVEALSEFSASAKVFLVNEGGIPAIGTRLRQSDLARSYQYIAEQGTGWFYGGEFAQRLETWMNANGGVMDRADLSTYQVRVRRPVRSRYRDYELMGFPPPSSGGVHTAQILNILEHFDLGALDPEGVEWVQLVVEAMKRAFADRAYWLGDPDFVKVPLGLVDRGYARALAAEISRGKADTVPGHRLPPNAEERVFGRHTTHFSVADEAGYWVACTATINTTFGSKVIVPGTGIMLNNEMDDFSLQPGVPNAFGLLGSEANKVEPGKRPLSSMSPTIVLREGQPWFSVGAAGGPTIISQSVLAIIRVIDFGMSLEAAVAAPRFHHQWRPDRILIEERFGSELVESLVSMGYDVRVVGSIGVTQAVLQDPEQGRFQGAADPRANGKSLVR